MFLDTIYKEDFHNFLKNPTDFILSGVVMNENEKGYYYRFIRVPMADGEHSVEALFGQICNTKPELDVYALSAYIPENQYAVSEKNAWLDAYLPEIDSEHRIFVACGSSKARAAANRLKTPCIDNSFVLLDDYSVNLHEWKANRGSCIKLRNGINGNGGTWKGESVTRFDTAENIADRIWSIIKKQMQ